MTLQLYLSFIVFSTLRFPLSTKDTNKKYLLKTERGQKTKYGLSKKGLPLSEQEKQRILELLWLMLINEMAYKEGIVKEDEYIKLRAIIESKCHRERSIPDSPKTDE